MEGPYSVTRYSSLRTIAKECTEASNLLGEYGLSCQNCKDNEIDSVENAADKHGLSNEEMLEMLSEINAYLREEYETTEH